MSFHPLQQALVIVLMICAAYPPVAYGGFIDDSNVSVGAIPGNTGGAGSVFQTSASPFTNQQSVSVANVSSSASYNFLWDITGGVFDINTNIEVLGLPGFDRRATSRGSILITSQVPLLVSASSNFNYDLTAHPMVATLTTGISRVSTSETIAGELISYSTTSNGPRSSFLNIAFDSILLPPNESFLLIYSFVIDTDDDVPISTIATGVGSARFEFVAVPEPSAALLVMVAVTPVLLRRRRGALADRCDR